MACCSHTTPTLNEDGYEDFYTQYFKNNGEPFDGGNLKYYLISQSNPTKIAFF